MSRHLRNSGLRRRFSMAHLLAGVLSALVLVAPATIQASPRPIVMGPTYVEPSRTASNPAPPSASGCRVQIVELSDARRGPETLGVLNNTLAIQAPPDREAWLRSIFEVGLAARGFKPSVSVAGTDPSGAPDLVAARIRLRAVWISLLGMNKSGSLSLQASASASGAVPTPEKIYRGDKTSINMMGSQSEFNELLNQVFAEALDSLSADLRTLCAAPIRQ